MPKVNRYAAFQIGSKHGKLTVLSEIERVRFGPYSYGTVQCRCECGKTKRMIVSNIYRSKHPSCGCNQRSSRRLIAGKSISGHPLHSVWKGIKARCLTPSCPAYPWYGARGIGVCDEWRNDFMAFYNWAIDSWSPGLTIDRINNNGDYSPENCRWASRKTQSRNTRRNVMATAFGETKCISEWADDPRCVVKQATLYFRIVRYGVEPELALTYPAKTPQERKKPWL